MSPEKSKAISRRSFDEVFGQWDYAVIGEIFADDFVVHTAPNEIKGAGDMKKYVSNIRNAFPDLKFTIEDQIAEGDKVVTRWITRGTHEGEFNGVSATGNPIKATGITIHRLADGKIAEAWTRMDVLGLMKQIGAAP